MIHRAYFQTADIAFTFYEQLYMGWDDVYFIEIVRLDNSRGFKVTWEAI